MKNEMSKTISPMLILEKLNTSLKNKPSKVKAKEKRKVIKKKQMIILRKLFTKKPLSSYSKEY